MRKFAILLTILVFLALFAFPVSAEEVDSYIKDFGEILPDEFSDVGTDTEKISERLGIERILADLAGALRGEGSAVLGFFLTLVGFVALMALPLPSNEKISAATRACVGVLASVAIFSSLSGIFEGISATLDEISGFFASLIPIAVGVTALGGGASTAAVQATGMYTTVSLIGWVSETLMLPLVGLGFAMSMLSAFGSDSISALSRGIKSLFVWIIGILTALLGGTISLQTMISTAQDSAAMRTARYMASGLIPVVGSTVSGALSTLASGVSYAKGVIGAGAIAVIISVVLAPLVTLLAYRLALTVALMIATSVGAGEAGTIFGAFRFSLDTVTALYALSSIIYILEIIIFAKAGVALL